MVEPEDKAERGESENRLQYNEKADILSTSFDPIFIRNGPSGIPGARDYDERLKQGWYTIGGRWLGQWAK